MTCLVLKVLVCHLLSVAIMQSSHLFPQLLSGQGVPLLLFLGLQLHHFQLLSDLAVLPLKILETSLAGISFLGRVV